MGVMGLISNAKRQFKDAQFRKKEMYAKQEAQRLREERDRQGQLARAQAEKVRLERDVQKISAFTEKHKSESKLQKFGKGLSKVMNQAKSEVSTLQKQGHFKGLQIGAPQSSGSKGMQTGSRDVWGGSSNSGGFTIGPSPKVVQKKPSKPKRVIVEL